MNSEPFDEPLGLGDRLDDLMLQLEGWVARARPLAIGGLVVVVVAGLVWWAVRPPGPDQPIEDLLPLAGPAASPVTRPAGGDGSAADPPGAGPAESQAEEEPSATLVVHVIGAVRRPGLVTLQDGARISDAVRAAGGSLADADLERLNLASPLVDGMQVRVPVIGEGDDGGAGQGTEAELPLVRMPETGSADGGEGTGGPAAPVDLNRAEPIELETLPGIGPALAVAIVDWRTEHGPFVAIDDLESVPGIGPAKLAALRDLVAL